MRLGPAGLPAAPGGAWASEFQQQQQQQQPDAWAEEFTEAGPEGGWVNEFQSQASRVGNQNWQYHRDVHCRHHVPYLLFANFSY